MPKPITLDMLHAMSPDQRKTLHGNASGRDTPEARAVLDLLAQDDLMPAPKTTKAKTTVAKSAPAKTGAANSPARTARKTAASKTPARKAPATPRPAAKPRAAVHGRQA